MIITPETLQKRDRFQVIYPAMTCQDVHVWFNKFAMNLFPVHEIYFEASHDKLLIKCCVFEHENGFKISENRIASRRLVNKIRQIVGTTGLPKFKIERTGMNNVFSLTQIK